MTHVEREDLLARIRQRIDCAAERLEHTNRVLARSAKDKAMREQKGLEKRN
jgi:hypothetical protein